MPVNLIAIAAGVLLIVNRTRIARRQAFRRIPVLSVFDRVASHPAPVVLVGTAWIVLGVWGLID